jgi:hypothetical protein
MVLKFYLKLGKTASRLLLRSLGILGASVFRVLFVLGIFLS